VCIEYILLHYCIAVVPIYKTSVVTRNGLQSVVGGRMTRRDRTRRPRETSRTSPPHALPLPLPCAETTERHLAGHFPHKNIIPTPPHIGPFAATSGNRDCEKYARNTRPYYVYAHPACILSLYTLVIYALSVPPLTG